MHRRLAAGLSFLALLALPAVAAPAVAAPPSAPADGPEAVPNELLVGYVDGATPADRQRARSRADAVLLEQVVPAGADRREVELVRVSRASERAAARALEADPAVAYAEPNWIVGVGATATDTRFANGGLWGMYGDRSSPANAYGSQAAEAWAAEHTGSDTVYVGVIDEGIQFTHPDLNDNIWVNPHDPADRVDNDGNGYVDDVRGWDFANRDSSVYDGGTKGTVDNHGTHVAGTIGAEANGAGVVGVNWNVTMISGKFLGRNGGTIANATKAVDYFTDLKTRHGLNIVATNNSWGGGGFSQALKDAIARADTANILFIAAAGNSSANNDATASYPSNYDVPNVIAVASITSAGAISSFSNFGATTVDLGAPGSDIWSTTAGSKYASYSGTSMATPHVTGGAALYASTHPGATAAQVRAAILASAVPTGSLAGKTATGGRLDVSGF